MSRQKSAPVEDSGYSPIGRTARRDQNLIMSARIRPPSRPPGCADREAEMENSHRSTRDKRRTVKASPSAGLLASFAAAAILTGAPSLARADEGGVGFWVPGFFGSLTATPLVPGFSFALIYLHGEVTGGADVAFARQVRRGNIAANFTGNLDINIRGQADLVLAAPSYTFATPVLGGQANIALAVPFGRSRAEVDATLTGNLGLGGPGFTIGGSTSDAVTGFGDVIPQFSLRWNHGVHN